jgi:F-type H+-transporting ATPase subunit epsilon
MDLIVLTPEREIFSGEISSVKVPGANGQFEILKNHAPIVSSLVTGPVRIISSSGDKTIFNIAKGFIEVLGNEVSLLVQGVEEETLDN